MMTFWKTIQKTTVEEMTLLYTITPVGHDIEPTAEIAEWAFDTDYPEHDASEEFEFDGRVYSVDREFIDREWMDEEYEEQGEFEAVEVGAA